MRTEASVVATVSDPTFSGTAGLAVRQPNPRSVPYRVMPMVDGMMPVVVVRLGEGGISA